MEVMVVFASADVGTERLTVGVGGKVRWPILVVTGGIVLSGWSVVISAMMTTGNARLCRAT